MANITPTNVATGNTKAFVSSWVNMLNGDVGLPISFAQYVDKSVQVFGTFGVGGNLRFEGSNDNGVNWGVLTDPQGNALDFTLAKIELVSEATWLVRPRVTAGDGTTSLSVYALFKE